jgi:hypothetical protein
LEIAPVRVIGPISELDPPRATDPVSVIDRAQESDPVPEIALDRATVLVNDPVSAIVPEIVPGRATDPVLETDLVIDQVLVIAQVIAPVSVTARSRVRRVSRGRDPTVGLGTTTAGKPSAPMPGHITDTCLAPTGGVVTRIFTPVGISTIGRGDTGGGRPLGPRSPAGLSGIGPSRCITTTAATFITKATRST